MTQDERLKALEDAVQGHAIWQAEHDGRIDALWDRQHDWNHTHEESDRRTHGDIRIRFAEMSTRVSSLERKVWIAAGAAAGIGSVLGTLIS